MLNLHPDSHALATSRHLLLLIPLMPYSTPQSTHLFHCEIPRTPILVTLYLRNPWLNPIPNDLRRNDHINLVVRNLFQDHGMFTKTVANLVRMSHMHPDLLKEFVA